MTHMAAEIAKKTGEMCHAQQASNEDNGQNTELAGRYRQIGISAVAAAVRYQGVAKNPVYAPAPIKWQHTDEAAA